MVLRVFTAIYLFFLWNILLYDYKGTTEDKMVGWHYWLSEHEFEQTPEDDKGQGSLACCSSQSDKHYLATEQSQYDAVVAHLFVDEYLVCFQFEVVTNGTMVDILFCVPHCFLKYKNICLQCIYDSLCSFVGF